MHEPLIQRLRDTAQMRGQLPDWLLAEMSAAADALQSLVDAVKLARNTFEGYAALHREKGTEDGYSKAALNQELAARMAAALVAAPKPEPPTNDATETLCRSCGQPTMHIGTTCYACSHQPEVPRG